MTTKNKKNHHPWHHRSGVDVPPRDYYPAEFERMILDGEQKPGERAINTPNDVYTYALGLNISGFSPRMVSSILYHMLKRIPERRAEEIRREFAKNEDYTFRNA